MKTSVSFLLIFLSLFLLTPLAISRTLADQSPDHDTFSFDGSTTSTSSKLAGHGMQSWHVTGYANISGNAVELGQDLVYQCELWLMATGNIVTSPFPDKGNIAAEAGSDGSGAKRKLVRKGDASILYKSHPVGSLAEGEVNIYDSQVVRELSASLSEAYANSASSPTGLCASPEFHGSLSGTLMNYSGSKSIPPLSLASKTNKACANSLDDGSQTVAREYCGRKQNCGMPGTAKQVSGHSKGSHYVECPEKIWVLVGDAVIVKRYEQQPCPSWWWTCDDDPEDPKTVNKCLRSQRHVKPGERSWRWKYVAPDGSVYQSPPTPQPCGDVYDPNSSAAYNHRELDHPCDKHTYYACQTLSSSETNRHTYQTMPCGKHRYYPCRMTQKHKQTVSCPTKNGVACSYGSYYPCSPHTHAYPSANNNNNGNSGNGNSGNSNNGNSQSNTVTCASGHTYKTTGKWATYSANYHRTRTCRRSGCGQSWQACVNGWTAPRCLARPGRGCWAQ